MSKTYNIAVMPGDGIGNEVMVSAIAMLDEVQSRFGGFSLNYETLIAGAAAYRDTNTAMSEDVLQRARTADAILFGAMGLPDVRYPDGTEIAPQLDLRFDLELYAGVRPIKAYAGNTPILTDSRWNDIDLIIIRESTEGLFAARGKGIVENNDVAKDTMVISRRGSQRLFDYTFKLAQRRKAQGSPGRATCVDKANVFASMAFFRQIFDETAPNYADVIADHNYIDATALDLIRKPWEFDVMVMENQFGDIISDQAAALIGGMGMAPSGDIGDNHAMFQPSHGSAPDIVGQGLANPTAMVLSAAMMLDWLGETNNDPAAIKAGEAITQAVERCFNEQRATPPDLGGSDGTGAMSDAFLACL